MKLLMGLVLLFAFFGCKKANTVNISGAGGSGEAGAPGLPLCPDGKSPGTHGPVMMHVGRLDGACVWIDETEVTRGQYQEFMDAAKGKQADDFNQGVCKTKNLDLSPVGTTLLPADLPVVGVDWCDADAFCFWANKTLCGTYNASGGVRSEFAETCTNGGDGSFDWSAKLGKAGGKCNASGKVAAVKGNSECVTPTDVYDLSGNVKEWTAECDDPQDYAKPCAARGGSFLSSQGDDFGCQAKNSFPRSFTLEDHGFRCCAPSTPSDGG